MESRSALAEDPDAWSRFFRGATPIYSDDNVVVFPDREPRAQTHLLVVPRRHIKGVEDLEGSHQQLVEQMVAVGESCLKQQMATGSGQDLVFGFHQFPLRSVEHLHLHCLQPPFR
mmetsp:Transcript_34423/g.84394  ORF Transcript_34423/g.84394 Transcript_34423/m.84394 type:complete len:115 (-) Transcript_34423:10-354(-)